MSIMTYETIPVIHSGPTEQRPTEHLVVGQQYFDTTLRYAGILNGTKWVVNATDVSDRLKRLRSHRQTVGNRCYTSTGVCWTNGNR